MKVKAREVSPGTVLRDKWFPTRTFRVETTRLSEGEVAKDGRPIADTVTLTIEGGARLVVRPDYEVTLASDDSRETSPAAFPTA